ncbi:phage head-tail connector protein [Staphylococcus aureus]|nr:phage head-tail connector protein [Staphylococcus aureus]AKJ49079.1 phage head-tail adapter protein [Staphylococcus aureus]AUJ53917.1 phage head-tail adapter protein [Staphylococcus aureus]AUJ55986.1 phage head-tail adapter protein [Staphylococcus aureus]AUW97958.1 phage head-tail adapter protein [Staphylococcus aureus]AWQ31548.1 phage head-tail adapter protein [Staphylococcus aureus]
MNFLKTLKTRIGIDDEQQDEQLKVIISNVEKELLAMLPTIEDTIPEEIEFIVVEVSTKRYNRIGAEGMTSETQDGRSSSYELNDFDEYKSVLNNLYFKDDKKGFVHFY